MPNQTYRDLKHHHSRHATIIDFWDTLKICSPMKVDGWHVIPFKYITLSSYTFMHMPLFTRPGKTHCSLVSPVAVLINTEDIRPAFFTSPIQVLDWRLHQKDWSRDPINMQRFKKWGHSKMKVAKAMPWIGHQPSKTAGKKSPAGRKSNPGPTMALKMATPAWPRNQLDRYPLRWIIRNDSWHLKSAQSMPLW